MSVLSLFLPPGLGTITTSFRKMWSRSPALRLTFSLSSLYLRPLTPWLRFVWQIIKEMELVGKNACNYWEYSILSREFFSDQLQWKKRTMIIENFPAYQACYIRLNLAPIKPARTNPARALKLTAASLWESDFSLYAPAHFSCSQLAASFDAKIQFFVFLFNWDALYIPATSNISR